MGSVAFLHTPFQASTMTESNTPRTEESMVFVDPDDDLLASDMEVADDPNNDNRIPDNTLDEDTMRADRKSEAEKKLGAYRKKKAAAKETTADKHPESDSDPDYETVYKYRKDADPDGVVKGKMERLLQQANKHSREILKADKEALAQQRMQRPEPTTFGGQPATSAASGASGTPAEDSRDEKSEDELSRAASRIKRDVR